MNAISRWFKHSSPLAKGLMGVSLISAFYVGNRLLYVPYARRQRHKQAEEWADLIIEQEERMQEQKVNQ